MSFMAMLKMYGTKRQRLPLAQFYLQEHYAKRIKPHVNTALEEEHYKTKPRADVSVRAEVTRNCLKAESKELCDDLEAARDVAYNAKLKSFEEVGDHQDGLIITPEERLRYDFTGIV
jgi:hypothetical protein